MSSNEILVFYFLLPIVLFVPSVFLFSCADSYRRNEERLGNSSKEALLESLYFFAVPICTLFFFVPALFLVGRAIIFVEVPLLPISFLILIVPTACIYLAFRLAINSYKPNQSRWLMIAYGYLFVITLAASFLGWPLYLSTILLFQLLLFSTGIWFIIFTMVALTAIFCACLIKLFYRRHKIFFWKHFNPPKELKSQQYAPEQNISTDCEWTAEEIPPTNPQVSYQQQGTHKKEPRPSTAEEYNPFSED